MPGMFYLTNVFQRIIYTFYNTAFTELDNYQPSSEAEDLDLDLSIAGELAQYMNDDEIVHGIGRVERGLNGRDEDTLRTNIIWKNVFVGNRLPDDFDEESFGVAYENSFEL
jgi:hypothetical protein